MKNAQQIISWSSCQLFLCLCLSFFCSEAQAKGDLRQLLNEADSLLGADLDSLALLKLDQASGLYDQGSSFEQLIYHKLYGDHYLHTRKLRRSINSYLRVWNVAAKTEESTNTKAKAINDLGIAYYRLGNIDSATICHAYSLKLYDRYQNYQGKSYNYNNLGVIFGSTKQFDSAIFYHQRGVRAAIEAKDTLGIAFGFLNTGIHYSNLDRHRKAIAQQLNALRVFEQMGQLKYINHAKLKLSSTYVLTGDYQKAFEHLFELQHYYQEEKNIYQQGRVALNISTVHQAENRKDSALYYLDQCIHFYGQLENPRWLPVAYTQKGLHYFNNKDYEKALKLLYEADSMDPKTFPLDGFINNSAIVRVHLALGQYKKAQQVALRVIKGNEDKIRPRDLVHLYEALHIQYEREGNLESAIQYLKKHKGVEDSLIREKNSKEIARMEYDYKSQQEQAVYEAEKGVIEAELEQKQWQLYLSLLGVLAVLLIAAFAYRSYLIKKKTSDQLQQLNTEIFNQKEEILQQAEELKVNNEKLVQLNQFKEDMGNMVVHDFKAPLNAILWYGKGQEEIFHPAQRLQHLLENFLDVHRVEEAKLEVNMESVLLANIVRQAFRQTATLTNGKSIAIDASFPEELSILVDQELILRVIVNLVSNAVKYTPTQGRISLSAQEIDGGLVRIALADTGQGIPQDKLATLFDKYTQVEMRKSGNIRSTGLGLTFCKIAIEAHGGTIWVESEEGSGTVFYFIVQKGESETGPSMMEINERQGWELSLEDKIRINPHLPELLSLKDSQLSAIRKVLKKIPSESNTIESWQSEIVQACFANNASRYQELLAMAKD